MPLIYGPIMQGVSALELPIPVKDYMPDDDLRMPRVRKLSRSIRNGQVLPRRWCI